MTLQVRRAFAAAGAAAIGVGIGHGMTFPHTQWAVITALTLLAPAADGTAIRTLWRVVGTAGAALGVVAVYGLADPQPEWIILASLAAMGIGFSWMPYTQARYAVVLFLPMGGAFALIALESPEQAPALVGYRVFFIALGSMLVMALSALLRCTRSGEPATPPPPLAEALLHALRLTLASALGMVLAAVARRPDLAPGIVITTLVLGTMTGAEAARGKGVLRFGGALAGGVISVAYYVLLLDLTTSIWSLMTVVFVVTWLCALLLAYPAVAYLAVQTGFVFAWSIGDAQAPTGDVWVPLERMLQVAAATGILVAVYRLRVPAGLRLPRAVRSWLPG